MTTRSMVVVGLETTTVRPGGLNRYVERYADGLRRRGVEVEVLAVGAPAGPSSTAPLPARLLAIARQAWALRRTPILDVHFALYGLLPMLLVQRRARRIVHFHGPWAAESAVEGRRGWSNAVRRRIERAVYRRADTVVALSEAFKTTVVADYGVDPARVTVIGGGVDTVTFSPGDGRTARTRFDLPVEGPVVVAVRRLVQRMGHTVLFDALVELRERGCTPTLLVVGDGPEAPSLVEAAADRGLASVVHFVGRLADDDLVAAYRAATCSVVPSVALEGFGLVALESLACATPVVASSLGGLVEVLSGLDPGLLCQPESAVALADALERVLSGEGPSPEACRRYALDRSWDTVVAQHLDLVAPTRHRVCYLGHGARLSGGELALLRQLPALYAVDPVVVLGEDGPVVDELRVLGIPTEVLAMSERLRETRRGEATLGQLGLGRLVDLVTYVAALRRTVRRLRPDVLHTNTLKAALLGGVAGRSCGVPVVWHLRDRIAEEYLPAGAVHLVRLAARILPSAIVANSASTLATVPGGRLRLVIASPLDPHAVPGPRGEGPFTVTMVGRLSPWKGQDLFLEAFAKAFPFGDARARIVGEALFGEEAYAAALRDLVVHLGIADRVDFLGFQRDVAPLLQTSDVQVVASRIPEPFGNVVLEGMACGVTVVAPNAGGPAEMVVDGETGVLVPSDDVEALAEALEALAADPARRARLARAAREVVEPYRPAQLAPRYHECYATLCNPAGWR